MTRQSQLLRRVIVLSASFFQLGSVGSLACFRLVLSLAFQIVLRAP
jgi:hypothetical protein